MLFTSSTFIFGFLPLLLIAYYIASKKYKNFILLTFSLFFYAWGEVFYFLILLLSIILNYFIGLLISRNRKQKTNSRRWLIIGVFLNLTLLISFKYASFIANNINVILVYFDANIISLEPIHLPLGISFFTFQAISYIVDVYRQKVAPQQNIFNLALYISLFPQLIAGPIVRYSDIASQIKTRKHSLEDFSKGVKRFIYGFAKKMLIANPLGEVVDTVFQLSNNDLTLPIAWIGILFYTLQIYYDFSGYSDMAIGLGRMFGFKFLENFNYPYISTSLREFWQRWHISLSTWFRDYVYIPLGGNRVTNIRIYVNLFIVFILTGLWHGAAWNFLIWGLVHGLFLIIERLGFLKFLQNQLKIIQHIYLLTIIVVSWVFFRSDNINSAFSYLLAMFNFNHLKTSDFQFAQILNHEVIYVFCIGLLLSTPFINKLNVDFIAKIKNQSLVTLVESTRVLSLFLIFFVALSKIAASTYNPFIYFRF